MKIFNLVIPLSFFFGQITDYFFQSPPKQSAAVKCSTTAGQKRGRGGRSDPPSTGDVPDTSVSFTEELRKLKNHLACERHQGQHCYINKVSGEHEFQDIYKLTFWAKAIVRTIFPLKIYVLTTSQALRRCDLR